MRLVIGKFHVNLLVHYHLSQVCAAGQQNHSDEEEDWAAKGICQEGEEGRILLRCVIFSLSSKWKCCMNLFWLISPFPDSSSSDSSSDSDSDSSSTSSSSDDEDEKKEGKNRKKKKEWHSKLVPAHEHLPLFPSLSVVANYLTRPCKINVSEWGLWAFVQWPRLQTKTYLLWSQ